MADKVLGQEQGHTPETTSVRGVLLFLTLLLVALAVIHASLFGLIALFRSVEPITGPWTQAEEPPKGAYVEGWASPPRELLRIQDEAREKLSRYEWLDPEAGIVRIPIERAMRLTAERMAEEQVDER